MHNIIDPEQKEFQAPQGEEQQAAPPPAEAAPARKRRGFAAIDRTLVREIARKGGKAAHAAGTAHEFTSEEARVAGRKGGQATHANRRRPADEATPQEHPQK
jgi:general stress protein YciG